MSDSPLTIAVVVGSLRSASFNRSVFEAARELFADRATLIEASIADVPLFNEDVEAAGDPAAVQALKSIVAEADALIIFTPEYNRSMPGVTKNAVDWLSRPHTACAITGRPVGIVAAAAGPHDAGGVRGHLSVAAAAAGGVVHEPSLGIPSVWQSITDGVLADDKVRADLVEWGAGFFDFVDATIVAAVDQEVG